LVAGEAWDLEASAAVVLAVVELVAEASVEAVPVGAMCLDP